MGLQIKSLDPRPCIVFGKYKALLHGFADNACTELSIGLSRMKRAVPSAIVEYEDGQLEAVPVNKVRMLDSAELFIEFDFGEGGIDGVEADR